MAVTFPDRAALKSFLRIPADDDQDDAQLDIALAAATAAVKHFANRTFTEDYADVPWTDEAKDQAAVDEATLLQASRFFTRRNAPFGIAGSPDQGGDPMRLLAKLDPDAHVLLWSVRDPRDFA